MISAILDDRTDFLKVILEQGISLRNFLTHDRLELLYNKVLLAFSLLILTVKSKASNYNLNSGSQQWESIRYFLLL